MQAFLNGLATVPWGEDIPSDKYQGPGWYVGDVSKTFGGDYHPHSSHQSGIDVDLAIPNIRAGRRMMSLFTRGSHRIWGFKTITADQVDMESTLAFLRYCVEWGGGGKTKYILWDRTHINKAKELARNKVSAGQWPQSVWDVLFKGGGTGWRYRTPQIIKHQGGHANHFHIRLKGGGPGDPTGRGHTAGGQPAVSREEWAWKRGQRWDWQQEA